MMNWADDLVNWGAYVIGVIAMGISKLVYNKFGEHEKCMLDLGVKVISLETRLIENQLDSSRRYVDKQEYISTVNRLYDKLDTIDKSINVLNSTLCGKE